MAGVCRGKKWLLWLDPWTCLWPPSSSLFQAPGAEVLMEKWVKMLSIRGNNWNSKDFQFISAAIHVCLVEELIKSPGLFQRLFIPTTLTCIQHLKKFYFEILDNTTFCSLQRIFSSSAHLILIGTVDEKTEARSLFDLPNVIWHVNGRAETRTQGFWLPIQGSSQLPEARGKWGKWWDQRGWVGGEDSI